MRSLSKVCSFTCGGKKVQASRDITQRCWKPQEQLVDVPVPHIMAPSPRTMMVSLEVVEIFPQERMRADLRTQILEGIVTFLLERDSERIEDQTVDVPAQQKIFEEIMDVHQERLSKRTGQQFDNEPVSQVMKEIFEVAGVFPQDGSQQYTAEENEVQPLIMEEIVELVRFALQDQISERICEQNMEVSVSQDTEQLIEVAKTSGQDRILHRAVE